MGEGRKSYSLEDFRAKFGDKKMDREPQSRDFNRKRRPEGNHGDRPRDNRNGGGKQKQDYDLTIDKATAPYNFVPLPTTVLSAPFIGGAEDKEVAAGGEKKAVSDEDKYTAYVQKNGDLSGVIELDIETRTPFFIGGNGEKFFAPADRPVIPGSTMRGMVKNIMKILTCGAVRPSARKNDDSDEIEGDGDFHDRKLYFRTMADAVKSVRKAYTDEMTMQLPPGSKIKSKETAKAGFLICYADEKGQQHYAVCPAELDVPPPDDETIRTIIKKFEVPNDEKAESGNNGECVQWDWQGNVGSVACFVGEMNTGNKRFDKRKNKDVYAGKARYTIHHSTDWKTRLDVPKKVVADYRGDSTRRGVNLFHEAMGKRGVDAQNFTGCDDGSFVVPCFYVADGNTVRHFGFGRYYRIPYSKNIGRHVPEVLRRNTPDFTDALFGRKEEWGSRLYFEDCISDENTCEAMNAKETRILATPNPTSFQLYLEQPKGGMKTWNDAVPIRGYKLYWHHEDSLEEWKHRNDEPTMKDMKPIAPIKSGAKFHGKIRFERLSDVELGALLKVFELADDKEVCFKLGRGKSIGMGSVRIDATLRLIDKSTYTELFDDSGWHKGETGGDGADMKPYTKKFDDYRDEKLDNAAKIRYDLSQRTLIAMLDWRKTKGGKKWTEETSTMQKTKDKKSGKLTVDARFRARLILPDALTVASCVEGKP